MRFVAFAVFLVLVCGVEKAAAAPRTVTSELDRMLAAGAITQQDHDARLKTWQDALSRPRQAELAGAGSSSAA